MRTLNNIRELEDYLLEFVNGGYFKKSSANYVIVNKIVCTYDEQTGKIFMYYIHISWGRYFLEEEKKDWNEQHTCVIPVYPEQLENYDFILGKFVSVLDGGDYDTTEE